MNSLRIWGTPINVQDQAWQYMTTARTDRPATVQVVGQWTNHGVLQPATFSIWIEIRDPSGFIVDKFPNDAQIHDIPPSHSAWVRLADIPGHYSDNDTYWPDPLRFIVKARI